MKQTFKKGVNVGAKAPVNLLEVLTDVPTKKWLLMFLGTGELGPADGSQITDLDNYGYQRFPTFETEFNIFVPQAVKGYIESDAVIQQYMLDTYGKDIEIVMIGHSLGARNVMEFSYAYQGIKAVPNVVGFIPIAGEMSWPLPTDWCTAEDKPIVAVCGDKDQAIWCGQSGKYVDAINSCPTRKNKAVLRTVKGKDHTSIMSWFFEPSRDAEGYKTIMGMFSKEQEVKDIEGKVVLRGSTVVAIFDNGQERTLNVL